MEGDDIKITSWMGDMTFEDIKMHLTLLLKSIQETENLYFIWCLQKVLNFEVSIILPLVSKHIDLINTMTWNDVTYPYITLFYTCHY